MIQIDLLPRLGVDLNAVNTAGSAENARLLRQNQAQFVIMSALVAYNARTGKRPFEDDGHDHDLRIISTLWLSTDHFVVPQDLAKSGTIFDFLALKGETVSLGKKNSGTLVKNQALLSNLAPALTTISWPVSAAAKAPRHSSAATSPA